ncbi:MAG: aldehyde dehydrogenase EutE [Deltaproteobacteria bacterium]|nr:MAG: aldehyde dehydrogenase EutE [Deltaproteobacteria bacterium]
MIDEKIINQVVEEVVRRLVEGDGQFSESKQELGETQVQDGVFDEMEDAIKGASLAQKKLVALPLSIREKIIEAIRNTCLSNAKEYARMEWEETGLGKVEDNKKKIEASCKVMGMEDLRPEVYMDDGGISVIERIPYGVIASVNPITNGAPTIIFNAIMMIAGGNSVVNNPHPKTKLVSAKVIKDINQAVISAGGPPNTVCCVKEPSVPSAQYLMTHPEIKLIAVTGGHGVVNFATKTGKRVIAGGPGNPPVVVDETADLDQAARCIIEGASFSNCTPCASEKEIFVVESVADRLKDFLKKYGAYEITPSQGEALVKNIFKELGEPGRPGVINMDFIGKPPSFILASIGLEVGEEIKVIILETDFDHPLVWTEQIMPVLPLVRCKNANEAINRAVKAEQGLGHTMIMHSNDLNNLSKMASMADACAFVKNGSSLASVGVEGAGFISFHIATDGDGHTRPRIFTRARRCTLSNDFRMRFGAGNLS